MEQRKIDINDRLNRDDEILADGVFRKEKDSEFEKIKQERDEYKNKYLYALAENENTSKRLKAQMNMMSDNAKTNAIKEFLVICDDFKRAFEVNEQCDNLTALKNSFVILYNEFITILEKMKVRPMDNVVGSEFTTELYEAVSTMDCGNSMRGKVVECVEDGYFIGDAVLRHAKVVVGK